jgi:hypothetical protein
LQRQVVRQLQFVRRSRLDKTKASKTGRSHERPGAVQMPFQYAFSKSRFTPELS